MVWAKNIFILVLYKAIIVLKICQLSVTPLIVNMSLGHKVYYQGDKVFDIYIYLDEKQIPWFAAKEVASAVGYADPDDAIRKHVDNLDQIERTNCNISTNLPPKSIFINKSGLYSLMLNSKTLTALRFQKWVTSELLPSLRQKRNFGIVQQILYAANAANNENFSPIGYVYMATNDLLIEKKRYKIGTTHCLNQKMETLNDSSPYEWRMVFAYETNDRFNVVKLVHLEFLERHIVRDFFEFDSIIQALDLFRSFLLINYGL